MGVAAIINIVLDIILMGPFGMGTVGTAYATVAAWGLPPVISLSYLKWHRIFFSMGNHSKSMLQWDKPATIVKAGLPATIRMAVINTAYLLVAGMFNQSGTAVSAASNVGLQVNTFAAVPCWAIGQAVTATAGRCMGTRQVGCARKVIKISLVVNAVVMLATAIGIQLFVEPLVLFSSSIPEAVNNGAYYLRIYCSVNSLIYAAMYTPDSSAIGVGAASVAMINALLNAAIVRLPVNWLLAFALRIGFPGIYYEQAISPVLPATVGLLYSVNKKWEHETLIQTDHKGRSL